MKITQCSKAHINNS